MRRDGVSRDTACGAAGPRLSSGHRVHVTSDRDRSLVSVATNSAHGSVRHVTYIGDVVQYGIDIGVAELKAEVHTASGGHKVAVGDKVLCEWTPQDMIVFEGETR